MLRLGILAIALVGASAAATLTSSPVPPTTTVVMLVERQGLAHNAATELVMRKNLGSRPIVFVDTRIATPSQLQSALHFAQLQQQRLGDNPTRDVEAVPRAHTATSGSGTDTPQLKRMARYLNALATHDLVIIKGIGKVRAISIVMQAPGASH